MELHQCKQDIAIAGQGHQGRPKGGVRRDCARIYLYSSPPLLPRTDRVARSSSPLPLLRRVSSVKAHALLR